MEKIKKNEDFRLCGNDKLNPLIKSGSGEIVLYQPEGEVRLEVRVENDTVWLTQMQMAELFHATKQNVSLHIANIFKEGELTQNRTVKEYLTVHHQLSCTIQSHA